jgi:DNA-binding transcriptional MocR family regulator
MDLSTLALDPADGRPRYRQLCDALAGAITRGELPAGARLPAERELAARLGVDEGELWVNYRLLQAWDRLSLHFCMRDVERGEPASLPRVPVGYDGEELERILDAVRREAARPAAA